MHCIVFLFQLDFRVLECMFMCLQFSNKIIVLFIHSSIKYLMFDLLMYFPVVSRIQLNFLPLSRFHLESKHFSINSNLHHLNVYFTHVNLFIYLL